MLRGLLSAKAGFGPTLTFLFVSPLLNPIIVGLMWATFGWKVTVLYAVIAAGVSVLASMLLDMLGFERHVIDPKEAKQSSCGTGCGTTTSEAASVSATPCCSSKAIKSVTPLKAQASCRPSQPEATPAISCCADGTAALTQAPVRSTAFAKARGIGDCGAAQTWAWTGQGFTLTQESIMGECGGVPSDLWPVTWRTR